MLASTPLHIGDDPLRRLTSWLGEMTPITPPLGADLLAGGMSNLTYRVRDAAGRSWALRRPPPGPLLPSAHDVLREYRILSALYAGSPVPVPEPVAGCSDQDVIGCPFMVMSFVEGLILRGRATAGPTSEGFRAAAASSLIDALVEIHRVDLGAVGLSALAPHGGYLTRQLARWLEQFHRSSSREVPQVGEAHEWLAARVPERGEVCLVHGDFRLDNAVLGEDGPVKAVLDWEISTLGDPIADLGLLIAYWSGEGDENVGATSLPGFPSRTEVIDTYAQRSGRDLSNFSWYLAFSYWKLACVAEGVYTRYASGGGGGDRRDRLAELEGLSQTFARRALLAAEVSAL